MVRLSLTIWFDKLTTLSEVEGLSLSKDSATPQLVCLKKLRGTNGLPRPSPNERKVDKYEQI
ncbi:MAG: hypothetical protein HY584_02405 [Candidatus Omnitrophica bacterium]|nr:hypothetical protein [Candidatus Omnitrophota bacterium]